MRIRAVMRAVLGAWFSLAFPGLGAGLVGRYGLMFAWVGASAASILACTFSVWLLILFFAVRLAEVIHTFGMVRSGDRADKRWNWPGALIAIGLAVTVSLALRATSIEAFKMPSTSMAPSLVSGDHIFADKLSPRWREVARGEVIVFRHPCEPDRDYVKRVIARAGETVEIRCSVVYIDGKPLPSELVRGAGCVYDDRDEIAGEWSDRPCSEYRETAGAHRYHVYHDPDRPRHDAQPGSRTAGDAPDFPQLDGPRQPPSCPRYGSPDLFGASPGEAVNGLGQLPGSIVETRSAAGPCEPQLHYVVPPGHVFVLGDNRSNSNDSRYWGSVPVAAIEGRVIGIWLSLGRSGVSLTRVGAAD